MSKPDKNPDKNSDKTKEEKPKRANLKLKRVHIAEARLAFMTLSEAQTRFTASQEAARVAQISVMTAKEEAQRINCQILAELGLSFDNIIDVENLIVLPPPGKDFLAENDG